MHECLNDCAELIFAELSRLLEDIQRFPKLHKILRSKIMDNIEKRKLEALETVHCSSLKCVKKKTKFFILAGRSPQLFKRKSLHAK